MALRTSAPVFCVRSIVQGKSPRATPSLTVEPNHMAAENDWWRTFFSGVPVEMWLSAPTPEMTKADVDFFLSSAQIEPGAKVLDVPCGGGRHSVELADRGYKVTGVDFSREFLVSANQLDQEDKVTFIESEMVHLPWPNSFDAVLCVGNSYPYMTDDLNFAFLVSVFGTLKPGGTFVLESGAVAESLLPHYQERRWYEMPTMLFAVKNDYDCTLGRLNTTYTFVKEGKVETRQGFQRVYTCSELIGMLKKAGFSLIEPFDALTRTPYKLGSRALLLVARKGVEG